ncbi:hypothetical protein J2X72_003916 [Phyllobacterium sp. 1468]|uniref:YybH family protein n=1 Tax=Phyllobacterium sp. 1468 TaxID=2817759 RepID=UPI002866437B|nr:nuclear transport factor 2 family protein [Phyllobacterium sp. 1468]MDR6635104.1 hypothetical protein [Phyllobacterium sp. 1468]
MSTYPEEISGLETRFGDGRVSDSLIEFYRAFNDGDIAALEQNWCQGDVPSMNNPIGGIRRGWNSIREGYLKLFSGRARVQVTFHDFTGQGGEGWHLFVGRERGVCTTPQEELNVNFRTTRWFILKVGVWRQLHHHGSVEDPQMLQNYKKLIFGEDLIDAQ